MAINPNKTTQQIFKGQNIAVVILFLLLAFTPFPTFAKSPTDASVKDPVEYSKHLFIKGDYYRAVSEITRLRFDNPEIRQQHPLNLMLLGSYLNLNQHFKLQTEATRLLEDAIPKTPENTLEIAGILSASLLKSNQERRSFAVWKKYCTGDDCNNYPESQKVKGRLDPQQARFYSSLLPGSGMLMSGDYGKAAVSFLLNLGFLYHGVNFALDGKHGIAGVLLFFEIGWYTGGKNATVESINLYNDRLIKRHQEEWISSKLNVISPNNL